MGWYLACIFGYAGFVQLVLHASQHRLGSAGAWLLFIGFLVANFIGIGLMIRKPGDSFMSGVKGGLLFGGQWVMYMAGILAVAFVIALLAWLSRL